MSGYNLYKDPQDTGALNNQPSNLNDARNTKFKFVCDRMPSVSYFTSQIIIPGLNGGFTHQATPLSPVPIPGHGKHIYQPLELDFVVDENLQNYWELEDWMAAINFPQTTEQYKAILNANKNAHSDFGNIYSDATLYLLTNSYTINNNVIFKRMFPINLSELRLSAESEKPEALHATATFLYLYRTRMNND